MYATHVLHNNTCVHSTPTGESPAQARNVHAFCRHLAAHPQHLRDDVPAGAPASALIVRLMTADPQRLAKHGLPQDDAAKAGEQQRARALLCDLLGAPTPDAPMPASLTASGLLVDVYALRLAVLFMATHWQGMQPTRVQPTRVHDLTSLTQWHRAH